MFCFRLLALKLQKFRTNFKRLIFYGDSKLFCRIALYGVRLRVGRGAGALGALGAKKQRPRLRAAEGAAKFSVAKFAKPATLWQDHCMHGDYLGN